MRIAVTERGYGSFRFAAAGLAVAMTIATTLLCGSVAEAGTALAMPARSLSASTAGQARSIAAWVEFCRRYAEECAVDPAEPDAITLTPSIWQAINAVNKRVNRTISAVTDRDHWNVPDRWDLAEDGSGDCEDFQLLKRKLLVEAGLPRRAMRMTVVIDEKGEGHAVLTLVTDRGDLILDNKTDAVLPWGQTGYTFVKRESQDALAWVGLGPVASPATTANR